MMHRFPNRTAALRSLKDISVDAIKHAKQLITEEDDMFCFDEDAAEQYLNSQSENNLEIAMTTSITNVKTATTAQLVEFYNDHAESSIKKFRDRATAEARCQAILDAIAEEESKPVATPVVEKKEEPKPVEENKVEGERAHSATQADTMKTSLKLDRKIVALDENKVYDNAYRMWKANPSWMTSSQQDTLTAKLYAAAKKGDKITVEINGRAFELLNV